MNKSRERFIRRCPFGLTVKSKAKYQHRAYIYKCRD
nr:MAG TPA: hypothetical protein [Caudoviricetes sp.]DAT91395.1 MAG TPA: hypothetical protein [Caudoviricetes sp.]